ncbi:MAG: trigger factor, partial [Dehalococcoidia bacterium]
MKITTEKTEICQLTLNIDVEESELEESLNEAYHRLVKKVSVPGFRKGKAPRAILEQHLGKSTLLEEALEYLVPQLYKQAIESEKIDAIDQPEIDIIQTEPVVLKAVIPLRPVVKLGNYRELRLQPEPVEVSGEEVEAAIIQLQQERGTWVPVERPVQFDDLITLNIEADVEGTPILKHKDMVFEVIKDLPYPLPGFSEGLKGMEKNKEKTFSLLMPNDHRITGFAGKECFCKAVVTEIKEMNAPQLDDDFAKSIGWEDLASMREQISANLRAKAEEKNRTEFRQKVLDAVTDLSEVDYPPILLDRGIDHLVADEMSSFGGGIKGLEDYLKMTGKTMEEHREELRPIAKQRVVYSLVMGKVAAEEKIEIDASEVDNKVGEITRDAQEKEKMEKFLSLPQIRESIGQSLHTQKTIDRLVQIASGNDERKIKEDE